MAAPWARSPPSMPLLKAHDASTSVACTGWPRVRTRTTARSVNVEDGAEQGGHGGDRQGQRGADLELAAPEAGPVDLGGVVDLVGYGAQPGHDDHRRQRDDPPHVHRDHRAHRQAGFAEIDSAWPPGGRRASSRRIQSIGLNSESSSPSQVMVDSATGVTHGRRMKKRTIRLPLKSAVRTVARHPGDDQDQDHRHEREHQRVEEGPPEHRVAEDVAEVAQADEVEAEVADGDVAHGEGDGEEEGEGHQGDDVDDRRGQEDRPEEALAVGQGPPPWRDRGRRRRRGGDGHGISPPAPARWPARSGGRSTAACGRARRSHRRCRPRSG